MKKGKEYEDFVYKIFSEYFKGFSLIQNDKIRGNESGLLREIDISIRGKVDNVELLFLVQAKDYKNHKSDINVIGAFSSVIKDTGASKGFLVCASGFANSNSQYARTLGIELLSVEDIESNKWKLKIEIPIIYVCYQFNIVTQLVLSNDKVNETIKLYKGFSITEEDKKQFSTDGGKTFLPLDDHISNFIKEGKANFTERSEFNFRQIRFSKYPTIDWDSFKLVLVPNKKAFLKYIIPDEFRGIRDHLNKTFIPTTFRFSSISLQLDSSYVPIDIDKIPINPIGFSIVVDTTLKDPTQINNQTENTEIKNLRQASKYFKFDRNDKINVKYIDGTEKIKIKYKFVENDLNTGKCKLIE